MTREEAIQILADLIDNPFLHTWEKQNKALHMAIEALQADVVSREECGKCKTDKEGVLLQQLAELRGDYETLNKAYNDALADRPHGEWIIDTYNMELRCPNCGEIFRFDDVDELLDYKEYAHYCLACGARMI